MKTNLFKPVLFVCLMLSLALSACGAAAPAATPTATVTNTPLPPTFTPTVTLTPTRTPTPTATPNLTATAQYDGFFTWVEKFAVEGIIPSVSGEYYPMDDYSKSFAKSGYFTWVTHDRVRSSNFIIQAKVTIANEIVKNASKSGCGFVFDEFVSNRAIFFSLDGNVNYRVDGYDYGSNYIDSALYENPDGVLLTLLFSNNAMRFYVNDRLALSGTILYGGPFQVGPSVLSGTSEGFGTRCDFTQIAIWDMD